MSNLAGVQIHRLVLRGDTRDKTSLLASLDAQRWPGDDDPRIIFIKRLQVTSSWWTLARELAQECEAEYHAATSAATATDTSNAIIFTCEAHLITQLLINLLRGQSPWYQQSWLAQAGLAPEPILVLLHRPALVPEVLQQLLQQQMLAQFFTRCSETDWRRLVEQVQVFLTINPALFARVVESSTADFLTGTEQQRFPGTQMVWVKTWLLPLARIRSAPAQQLALQLLTCLGLWKFSPQQMHQPSAWVQWLQMLGDSLHAMNLPLAALPVRWSSTAETADSRTAIVVNNAAELIGAKSNSSELNSVESNIFEYNSVEVKNSGLKIPESKSLSSNSDATIVTDVGEPELFSVMQGEPTAELKSQDQRQEPESGIPLGYRSIRHAGFLYLLNWLRDYPALVNLPVPLSPWLWLAHFYAECCAAWQLPLDKSLQRLLLDIGGLDEAELYQSGSSFQHTELRAARLFLQARLEKFQIDNYAWLHVPARVWVEQGYIQVYIHESCVRLALRLAGLDVNPGWVPSLGRVIQFYFGSYPELLPQVMSSLDNQLPPAAEGDLCDE